MTGYESRLARAEYLATKHPSAAPLMKFYAELARFQAPIFEESRARGATDPRGLVRYFQPLIELIARTGTKLLVNFAVENLRTPEAQVDLLLTSWEDRGTLEPPGRFYVRVLLQPFAEYLASRGDIQSNGAEHPACPFCNARPVAGVLRGEGEGAKRWLLCSLCSTEWQFRRVLCPSCGEENKDMLPIYTAPEFPTARVEACDTCHTYLKSIDLTKDGLAIPIVDELAAVALDIWAEERGYSKVEANLLGT